MTEHLRGYDAWKQRVPASGGSRSLRAVFFEAYRYAQRHGFGREWLDAHRAWPCFADCCAEADRETTETADE